MEFGAVVALSLAFVFWCVWAMVSKHQNHNRKNLGKMPPGPKGWPVVGNIFELSWACHETFTVLARKYGPVMTIRIGSMNAVVISSKETAEEMYKGHDVHLAGRKIYESMRGKYGYDGSLIMAQYGSEWRMLRRLFASEFTVVSRLNAMRTVRECCINQMVQCVGEASKCGTSAVEIPRVVFEMAFNLIGNLIISKDLLDPNSTRWSEFFYHAGKVLELTGKPNVADFLPILRWIDPQGIKRKTQFHVGRAFDVTSGFIEERRKSKGKKSDEGRRKDYLDVLLEFKGDGIEEPLNFSSGVINVIILDVIYVLVLVQILVLVLMAVVSDFPVFSAVSSAVSIEDRISLPLPIYLSSLS
ncbi:hypothetical protein HHK36_011616 [Tetracentron sinense]|uniref:Cytochrome P450 n=1 Tax=Tetracentron sinense TaxID=13715 RepID=A0A834ZBF0_TETSI|nr:hypothetical protein HHK36_011616 [Tetracentron sinense]